MFIRKKNTESAPEHYCNGLLNAEIPTAWLCALNIFFFDGSLVIQVGWSIPAVQWYAFVKHAVSHSNSAWPHHKLHWGQTQSVCQGTSWDWDWRQTASTGYTFCRMAQYQRKAKIAAAEVSFGQRGCSSSICCMKPKIWKPKSQLQKKKSSGGFFVRCRSTSKRN